MLNRLWKTMRECYNRSKNSYENTYKSIIMQKLS